MTMNEARARAASKILALYDQSLLCRALGLQDGADLEHLLLNGSLQPEKASALRHIAAAHGLPAPYGIGPGARPVVPMSQLAEAWGGVVPFARLMGVSVGTIRGRWGFTFPLSRVPDVERAIKGSGMEERVVVEVDARAARLNKRFHHASR